MNTDQVQGHSLSGNSPATLRDSFAKQPRAEVSAGKLRKRDLGFALLVISAPAHIPATSAAPNYARLSAAACTAGTVNPERLPAIGPVTTNSNAVVLQSAWCTDVVREYLRKQPQVTPADLAALKDTLQALFPGGSLTFSQYVDHEEGWHRLVLTVSAGLPADEYSRLEEAFYQRADASEPLSRALGHVIVSFA
jgi:hypothetical protein